MIVASCHRGRCYTAFLGSESAIVRNQNAMADDNAQTPSTTPAPIPSGDALSDLLASLGVQLGPDGLIAGKYRIERMLGRGGVGVVVQATHIKLNQRVAIKLLLPSALPDTISRFSREAQAAARLKNEHIARVLDVGDMPNGTPFMVMEFLEGCDLDEHLQKKSVLPHREAVDYILEACEALAEAHAAGIVHRDLKPANLFVAKRPDGGNTIKLLDFGISKDEGLNKDGGTGMKLTQTTAVFGSPLYMSPEQMRGARFADVRSDIWSLGVILYELCTGKPPFDAEVYPDLVMKVSIETPVPPSSIRRDLPSKLESVILRCLEKDPARRFSDIAKLAEALVPFASTEAARSATRAHDTLKISAFTSQSDSKGSPTAPAKDADDRHSKPESKSFILIGAALSGAAIAAGLLWMLAGYLSSKDAQPTTAIASPSHEVAASSAAPSAIAAPPDTAVVVTPLETSSADTKKPAPPEPPAPSSPQTSKPKTTAATATTPAEKAPAEKPTAPNPPPPTPTPTKTNPLDMTFKN